MYISTILKVHSRLHAYICTNNNYRRGYELKMGNIYGTGGKEGEVEIA